MLPLFIPFCVKSNLNCCTVLNTIGAILLSTDLARSCSLEVWSDAFRRSVNFLLFLLSLSLFITICDILRLFVIVGHLVSLSLLLFDVSQFALVAVLARACF